MAKYTIWKLSNGQARLYRETDSWCGDAETYIDNPEFIVNIRRSDCVHESKLYVIDAAIGKAICLLCGTHVSYVGNMPQFAIGRICSDGIVRPVVR